MPLSLFRYIFHNALNIMIIFDISWSVMSIYIYRAIPLVV